MDLWSMLEAAAREHPTRTSLIDGDERLDYAGLRARCAGLALELERRGVGAGERVALLAPNSRAFFETTFAVAGLGAVLCPLNVRLAPRELAQLFADAEPCLLLVADELAPLADQARSLSSSAPPRMALTLERRGGEDFRPHPVAPDDLAHLYYTSGTTGRAKGVMLSSRNLCEHALAARAELGLDEHDVWAHVAPMFHLADAWATLAVTLAGGTHVMLPRFEVEPILDTFEQEGVTLTNLVPTMLARLVHAPKMQGRAFPRLRRILSGGAPITPALVRRIMDAFGAEYVQTYGMTETSPFLTLSLLDERQRTLPADEQFRLRAKTGRPFATVELEVRAGDGTPVPADGTSVGEIHARGSTVTRGYWRRPEETAAAFDGAWLRTGDLATLDAEGFLDIVDRKKDVIVTGGENVYSTEVECVLCEHPDVAEAAVFGVADEEWGELVCAAVVLRPDADPDSADTGGAALTAFCRERLGRYKVPRRIELVGELPRTGSGKVSKRSLRERASS